MIKILSIGNRFSEDAHAYLYAMACRGGTALRTVNLYIEGCDLKTHWENARGDRRAYLRLVNGEAEQGAVSLREGLESDDWDIVTLQQSSFDSGVPDGFFPYAGQLGEYAQKYAPKAQPWLHQTWAYETDSDHELFERYQRDQQAMYAAIKNAYFYALCKLKMPVIPCGDVIQELRAHPLFDYANGGPSLCRDGCHLSLDYGRYAAAATWYTTLATRESLADNDFLPPMPTDPARIALIKEVTEKTVRRRA